MARKFVASSNFDAEEFACKCGCGRGEPAQALINALEALRAKCGGKPVTILSGYRCSAHNKAVGGVKLSRHCGDVRAQTGKTEAADIRIKGVPLAKVRAAALALGLGGVGYYPRQRFVHVDVRPGKKCRWSG